MIDEIINDGEASSSSCGSLDVCMDVSKIKSLVEEEERLLIENRKIDVKEESVYVDLVTPEDSEESRQSFEDSNEQTEAELKEKRYKRLMHLLRNSQMYAVILKSKLEEDEAKAKKNSRRGTGLNEVLNQKDIKDNSAKVTREMPEDETDFFKETRITPLGFEVSVKQPKFLEGGVLKGYQLKGLSWMINLFNNGVNGILADEMGLGKTIQVIAFICHLIEQDIKGPFLVVAPLSTISNWLAEFKKFAPKVPVMIYHGNATQRKQLRHEMVRTTRFEKKRVHYVVITSYQVPLYDRNFMKTIHWYYLIVDEGHCIKNHKTQLSETLRQFPAIGRLLLTGTPLQNNLSELWSLLNFLLPEVFSSLDVFESWFDIRSLEENGAKFIQEKFNLDVVSVLQEILLPFVLRREKKDVRLDVPSKKEILIYCPMSPVQKKLYQYTIDRTIEKLIKRDSDYHFEVNLEEPLPKRRCFMYSPYGKSENGKRSRTAQPVNKEVEEEEEGRFVTPVLMRNPQMLLRHIVNHPYLVWSPSKEGTCDYEVDEVMIKASGKLSVFDAIMAKLKAKGHRVLVLSFFTKVLDILEDVAILRGYKYCRFDGSSDVVKREEQIRKFTTEPDVFIFFTSIRAGGLGINLTSADTVVFFDSDWNPQCNIQAQNRCHRIGQTKPVTVYRLCALGTIDESILERGNAKRRLEKMILQKGKFTLTSNGPSKLNLMDLQELKKLLESTDHDAVVHSNGFFFTDEELDAALEGATQTSDEREITDTKGIKLINYEN